MLAQHRGDPLNDLGVGVFLTAGQLLGRGRNPLQKSTVGVGSGPGIQPAHRRSLRLGRAGLRRRFIIVLPFLTPTIASWWVGLVTPIPSGLARPLVESLHCNAVMADRDIDTVIAPPPAGLTGYRQAVKLALERMANGQVETSWWTATLDGEPSQPLPSDPARAGEIAYTTTRSAWTPATPDELWKVVDNKPVQRLWQVQSCEPGLLLRLRKRRMPGTTWLEMRVSSVSGPRSRYQQRAVFYPRGIMGRIYWYGGLPLHRRWFSQTFREVFACAGTTYGSSGSVTVSPEVRPPE